MSITIAKPTCAVVFDAPTRYVDRNLATASWFDVYEIQPGMYPLEWVNLGGVPWNADPEAKTPGFIANTGPYYAQATLNVRLVRTYRVNRLFTASSVEDTATPDAPITTIKRDVYAYQVPGCPKGQHGRPLTEFLGGRVVDIELNERVMQALEPTYGMCTSCGAIEVALRKVTGTRDLSDIGENAAYPTGYGCEMCD